MNLGEIRAEIRRYGFGDEPEYGDADLNLLINTKYQELLAAAAWPQAEAGPESVTIAAQTAAVTTPAGFAKPRALFIDGEKLAWLEPDDFLSLAAAGEEGTPRYYTIYGDELLVYPLADQQLTGTIYYLKGFAPLSSNSDEPAFPERHHYILVLACLLALDPATDNEARMKLIEEQYNARLELMKSDLLTREQDASEAFAGDYNAGSILHEVRAHIGNGLGTSVLLQLLNDTKDEIEALANWPWLEAAPVEVVVPANASEVTVADLGRPRRVQLLPDETEVEHLPLGQFLTLVSGQKLAEPGDPVHYTTLGSLPAPAGGSYAEETTLRLWPVPQSETKLRVWAQKRSGDISGLGDFPPFPKRHARVLVLGVLIRAIPMVQDETLYGRLNDFRDEYNRRLQIMVDDLLRTNVDRNPQAFQASRLEGGIAF